MTADRGLNSSENLRKIKELGMDYVIAFRLRSAGKVIQDQVFDTDGWEIATSQSIARLEILRYKITEETRQIAVVDSKTGEKKKEPLTSKLLINTPPNAQARMPPTGNASLTRPNGIRKIRLFLRAI